MRWLYLIGLAGIVGTLIADIWYEIDYSVAADVSLIYIAILSAAFAVRYAGWSKWWTKRSGTYTETNAPHVDQRRVCCSCGLVQLKERR